MALVCVNPEVVDVLKDIIKGKVRFVIRSLSEFPGGQVLSDAAEAYLSYLLLHILILFSFRFCCIDVWSDLGCVFGVFSEPNPVIVGIDFGFIFCMSYSFVHYNCHGDPRNLHKWDSRAA